VFFGIFSIFRSSKTIVLSISIECIHYNMHFVDFVDFVGDLGRIDVMFEFQIEMMNVDISRSISR
jgi:hypothetical protein